MNINLIKLRALVKGIFQGDIPYMPLIENGDSSPYFGTYEGQKYGPFDTSCCWDFSGCENIETRIETLWKLGLLPKETIDWLEKNGYVDEDGDIYLSRAWVAILSGVRDGGNYQINFWELASVAGVIPNKMLPYSADEARKWITQEKFNNEYFDPQKITLEMENMGKEFLKRFKIQAENLPGGYVRDIAPMLTTYFKEGSLQFGLPVPQDGSWNRNRVDFPLKRLGADHAVEGFKYDFPADPKYPVFIYDSYEPHIKQLSNDYYIPIITRFVITPLPVIKPVVLTAWQKFWANALAFFTRRPIPYPEIQLG